MTDSKPAVTQTTVEAPVTQAVQSSRRQLFGLAGAGAAGLLAAACAPCSQVARTHGVGANRAEGASGLAAPALSRGLKRLTMTTTWPKNLPGLGEAAERVARRIAELSEGRLTVQVYAAGELVPAMKAFDAVATGAADMYHGAEYYWQAKNRGFNYFTAVPFGMTAMEIMGWIDWGGGQALWEELSGQFNVIGFQAANTGHQMGGWFRREINSLEDFKGLKFRIPGLGGDVIKGLGGAPVTLAGGEIYQALQTGQIDATEWVGPWNDYALGFFREAPLYYGPGFHEPGSALCVGINRTTWDGLTASDQALIRAVCAEVNNQSLGEFTHFNAEALVRLETEHNTILRPFPDDVYRRAQEISRDVLSDAANSDPLAGRIHASFEAALKRMRRWGEVSEGPYYAARSLLQAR
jgi:TRAP-type mannitol/chloroaromatic compound transport system substrate-binding protein